ncbi:hypothetical protein EUX98_g3537 [Antrodiella citrinella]|uniref:Large ribosomal subunit protein uL29m n=1 Tax=Antrodiella citrinella TaxID=2447956 RepID=A0A4S4MWA1_9APHY|nr:hypothetical protein EUX98_g3537 [Antrodiella citrinella]
MIPSTSQLRGALSSCTRSVAVTRSSYTRSFASIVPVTSKLSPSSPVNGQQRPQLNIPVDPKHGLYGFFRQREEDGVVKYDTLEPYDMTTKSSELRRKSFKDLHTLWYVLLRERNLLATQREEGRRLQVSPNRTSNTPKAHRVRKSMARIKYVVNERRIAYERAVEIFAQKRAVLLGEVEEPVVEEVPKVIAPRKAAPKGSKDNAANLAAAGLFETVEVLNEASEKRS